MANPAVKASLKTLLAGKNNLPSAHKSDAGFTLVELMTVLVIIGLMTSAVVLSLPSRTSETKTYAENLVRDLNAAAQQSILTGKTSALGLSEDTFALMVFEDGEWHVAQEDFWPENIAIRFSRDETVLQLKEELLPLVLFSPTGETTPFELEIDGHDFDYRLLSEGDGRINLESQL